MKKFIIALLFTISSNAMAETNLTKYWNEFYPGQKCVMVHHFGYFITKSLGHNLYEMHTTASRGSRNAILKMNTKGFSKPGEVINVKVKYVDSTEMKTNDGFPAVYDLLEECS